MEDKPMRVLQMTASLFSGGSQNMIINIYKAIDRNSIQFDFILDHPEINDLQDVVESLGAKVFSVPTFNGLNIIKVIKAWNKFIKEHPEYTIIHSHSRSYASIYLRIAKKYGLKTIIHSHNTSNGNGIKAKIKNILQKDIKRVADYFFACSLNSGKWLFGEKIVSSNRFYILNNAIDASKFVFNMNIREKYRKELSIEEKKVFIQVGEFNEQKNHDFTIEMFKKIMEIDQNCCLLLVGSGENFEAIQSKIHNYGLDNVVKLLGKRKDVNNLLMAADCFIMPSKFEGLSVAAIEAQATGIPCLLSDNVSKDVAITSVCKFIPLDINKWVEESLNFSPKRTNTIEDIKKAGFDVKETAKWLENFYRKIG